MSTPNLNVDDEQIIEATRNWLDKAVIGLNLCPFAKAVQVKQQVRYVVSNATTPEALVEQLMDELQHLSDTDPEVTDTTLLIHPFVLTDFLDYNEFLDVADAVVEDMHLDGEIQVASFHQRHRQLHQPRAIPDPAPAARREHRARRGGVSGSIGDF
jgi:hypothetical protein